MPPVHASESPPLGWLVPCLAVADLGASLDWYGRLDFERVGGDPSKGWATLRNRGVEIHLFQGHIPKDLLNFRGGDTAGIRSALGERGFEIDRELAENSFIYRDADGREVMFHSTEEERKAYDAGRPLSCDVPAEEVFAGDGLDPGNLTWCCACADLEATSGFYRRLGLVEVEGEPKKGWLVLARTDQRPEPGRRIPGTYLSFFQDMIPADSLNFRGGDVAAIGETLAARGIDLGEGVRTVPNGGGSLLIVDPDERPVFFDTAPAERLDVA